MEQEPTLFRVECPQHHDVVADGDYFWCEHCMKSYDADELIQIPVTNRKPTRVHPTVYGRPN